MKKKQQKWVNEEWAEFQTQHQLSDEDVRLARQTGSPLKRFQDLLGTDGSADDASKVQRIREFHRDWQEKVAKRQAEREAGVIEPANEKRRAKKLQHDAKWAEAKQVCRLNIDDIRKAKELGLSPQALIKNVPGPSQKWKAPVKVWIHELYEKRIASRCESSKEPQANADDSRRNAEPRSTASSGIRPGISHDSVVQYWNAARMDRASRLRVISRIGVGYDNIDVKAATERGIVVCYTPHCRFNRQTPRFLAAVYT